MSHNPFEVPQTMGPHAVETAEGGLSLATQGQRFGNFFIDGIIVRIASFAVGLFVGGIMVAQNGGAMTAEQEAMLNLVGFVLGLFVVLGYYVIMEAAFQKTIGKMITGTHVVTVDGNVPSFGQIVGRSFARMIPFEPLSFFGKTPAGWHDTLSGTRVIRNS